MNWLLVETPPKQRAVAILSADQRRAVAEQAGYCVKWLKAQGFGVLRVERGPMGERRYSFATRFECEVRWYDKQAGVAA